MKESQTKENLTVRWGMGLNKRRVAYLAFTSSGDTDSLSRLMPGDELKISYKARQNPSSPV